MSQPKLALVSFTGADNKVDPNTIVALSERYLGISGRGSPVLEWGLLIFPEKEGQQRNPTYAWRTALLDAVKKSNSELPHLQDDSRLTCVAAHLCGEQVFYDLLAGGQSARKWLAELQRYNRVQVNINARRRIFSTEQVFKIYDTLIKGGVDRLIMQVHDDSTDDILTWTNDRLSNSSILGDHSTSVRLTAYLYDSSRGKGVHTGKWKSPHPYVNFHGHAGGINPGNIHQTWLDVREVMAQSNAEWFWLDGESGFRTEDNEFSIPKVIDSIVQLDLLTRGGLSKVQHSDFSSVIVDDSFSFTAPVATTTEETGDGWPEFTTKKTIYAIRIAGTTDQYLNVDKGLLGNCSLEDATHFSISGPAIMFARAMSDLAVANNHDARYEAVRVKQHLYVETAVGTNAVSS